MKHSLLVLFLLTLIQTSAQNPMLRVVDTDFSKGRLLHEDTIYLADVSKFHGHLCDGLAVGFLGLSEALYKLYPNGTIDRTNLRIVSKSSPCISDIAIYLTGARYQYNTFYIDDSMDYLFIVQEKDKKNAWGVKLKVGVKPAQIDSLGALANKGLLAPCDLDNLRKMEDDFTQKLLHTNAKENFVLQEILNFTWEQKPNSHYLKTDILNKNKEACSK